MGEVKDLMKNYIQLPAKDGYETVKNQLDPQSVIAAYPKEPKNRHKSNMEMVKVTGGS